MAEWSDKDVVDVDDKVSGCAVLGDRIDVRRR